MPKAHSSIVLHHSNRRGTPVLVSAILGSRPQISPERNAPTFLGCHNPSMLLHFSWNFPFSMLRTVACCQQLHLNVVRSERSITTPLLSQARSGSESLRPLSQHARTNCPVLDSQEVHLSSWEDTARIGTGMLTKRTRSFKLPLQFKLATGKVVGVRRAVYPGGGPSNGHL